jgi:hypothetical protein
MMPNRSLSHGKYVFTAPTNRGEGLDALAVSALGRASTIIDSPEWRKYIRGLGANLITTITTTRMDVVEADGAQRLWVYDCDNWFGSAVGDLVIIYLPGVDVYLREFMRHYMKKMRKGIMLLDAADIAENIGEVTRVTIGASEYGMIVRGVAAMK